MKPATLFSYQPTLPPAHETQSSTSTFTFVAYLLYAIVEFLNIGVRYSVIGALRPTVLLFLLILGLLVVQGSLKQQKDTSSTTRIMWALIAYILLTIPFVEWPGSVLRQNFQEFLKVAVFFFFTIQIIDTMSRLKVFVLLVIGLQVFRVLEPLRLHITTGYWGSKAHAMGADALDRLSGAPSDVINPNGLGFLIVTALPFLHFLLGRSNSWTLKVLNFLLLGALLYALILTGSRSALVGLVVVLGMLFWKSTSKGIYVVVVVTAFFIAIPVMNEQQRDRFVSLIDDDSAHAATRAGRTDGMISNFKVGFNRPVFGHGLGTGREAVWNVSGGSRIPHNLYAEAFIELGGIGLAVYCALIFSFIRNAILARHAVRLLPHGSASTAHDGAFLMRLAEAVHVWVIMCLVFSLAQYGISEFHWYLMGGISVAMYRQARTLQYWSSATTNTNSRLLHVSASS